MEEIAAKWIILTNPIGLRDYFIEYFAHSIQNHKSPQEQGSKVGQSITPLSTKNWEKDLYFNLSKKLVYTDLH